MKRLFSLILCITFCLGAFPNIFITSVSAAATEPKRAVSFITTLDDGRLDSNYPYANHYYYYYGNDPKLLKIPKGAILTDGSDLKNLDRLVVPKGVKIIGKIESNRLKELDIGMSDIMFEADGGSFSTFRLPNLTKFNADKNNLRFSAKNGILYNKYQGITQLVAYPTAKKGSYLGIDKHVSLLGAQVFNGNTYIKKIVLPANLKNLYAVATFANCKSLIEVVINGKNRINFDFGDYGFSGPNLKRIVINNKNAGFILPKDTKWRANDIALYKQTYKKVTFYVKPNSRALQEVQEIGLRYKIMN